LGDYLGVRYSIDDCISRGSASTNLFVMLAGAWHPGLAGRRLRRGPRSGRRLRLRRPRSPRRRGGDEINVGGGITGLARCSRAASSGILLFRGVVRRRRDEVGSGRRDRAAVFGQREGTEVGDCGARGGAEPRRGKNGKSGKKTDRAGEGRATGG
jgi:hypothetical protein